MVNQIDPERFRIMDKMLMSGYPIRVICQVAAVAKGTVQRHRYYLTETGALDSCRCPCGKPLATAHDIEPCERRSRRTRLLLRIVGRPVAPPEMPPMADEAVAIPESLIADFVVVSVLTETGFSVMARFKSHPDYWRKIAWFPTKSRAESYVEIENMGLEEKDWTKPEECEALPDLPTPQSVVTPERFVATEEITETTRREFRSLESSKPRQIAKRLDGPTDAIAAPDSARLMAGR